MYILGASEEEQQRLQKQAELLRDEVLLAFCRRATKILDVGCGPGTLLPLIRTINKNVDYVGIDLNKQAIDKAKKSFSGDTKANFIAGDVLAIEFGQHFDLVISRLFLWSIKSSIHTILAKCKKVLKSEGFFYSYEPNDRQLEYYPSTTEVEKFLASWQKGCIENGADPFIGRNVAALLNEHDFSNIQTQMHGMIISGVNSKLYEQHASNLARIFLNPNHPYVQTLSKQQLASVENALLTYDYHSVISQCYIITTGQKA